MEFIKINLSLVQEVLIVAETSVEKLTLHFAID